MNNYLSLGRVSRNTNKQGLGGAATSALSAGLIGGGISAGVSLATSAVGDWLQSIQLSHNADTATTLIVNRLATLLQANVDAYLAGPGTCQDQALALSAYDTAISWMQSPAACGNPNFGSAGNRCISDRIGSGAKWPWQSYYRDPIANDPRVAGCSANALASNPDAGTQAALQNILNVTSGSSQVTNPIEYASGVVSGSNSNLISGSGINSSSIFSGFSISPTILLIGGVGLLGLLLVSTLED